MKKTKQPCAPRRTESCLLADNAAVLSPTLPREYATDRRSFHTQSCLWIRRTSTRTIPLGKTV